MPMIEITNCGECNECHSQRFYTGDSFETEFEYTCKLKKKRLAILSWNEGTPVVPKWCPKLKKEKKVGKTK